MKKVVTILAVTFCTLIFNSCTDLTEDLITENEVNENHTFLIEKDKIEKPDDRDE